MALETSDDEPEGKHAQGLSKDSASDEEKKRNFQTWKNHYEAWLQDYKIPRMRSRRNDEGAQQPGGSNETRASETESRRSEAPRKRRSDNDGSARKRNAK